MEENTEQDNAPAPIGVSKGNPTDEELAAAVTVLSLALAPRPNPRPADDRPLAGGWRSFWRTVRVDHRPGRGAWTARF